MLFNQRYKYNNNLKLYKKKKFFKIITISLLLSFALSSKSKAKTIDTLPTKVFEDNNMKEDNELPYIKYFRYFKYEKGLVAITFDDGPGKYTDRLLDILDNNNAHATFFLLGSNIHKYPETLIKMNDNGNDIGLHGYSHSDFTELSIEEINEELDNETKELDDLEIIPDKFVRPPYGSIDDTIKEDIDYSFILWSVDTLDWKSKNKDKIIEEVKENIKPGSILLFHDIHETTVDAIEELLPELSKDYEFVTVSELYSRNDTKMETNKVYSKIKKK